MIQWINAAINIIAVDVTSKTYTDFNEKINLKDPKFKVGDHLRISNWNIFLPKAIFQVGQKKSLWLQKVKNFVP